jgi:hypothetical protein
MRRRSTLIVSSPTQDLRQKPGGEKRDERAGVDLVRLDLGAADGLDRLGVCEHDPFDMWLEDAGNGQGVARHLKRRGRLKRGFGRTPAGARLWSGIREWRTLPSSEMATSQKSRWTSNAMNLTCPPFLGYDVGDQAGKRQLRMRARSTTGSVAGATSYNNGLAAHIAQTAYPSCVLPKSPWPGETHDSGTLLPDLGFSEASIMPLQHRSRPHGTTHEGTNPRAGHRKGEDVGKAEVMCRLYLGSAQPKHLCV